MTDSDVDNNKLEESPPSINRKLVYIAILWLPLILSALLFPAMLYTSVLVVFGVFLVVWYSLIAKLIRRPELGQYKVVFIIELVAVSCFLCIAVLAYFLFQMSK
ncbi:hypothetical protein [Spartinivicinus poritis]|uniref:Uncharacterized protein n=1 Tax=Spartinivicinus poritis TaxID=2994640 RepID=A0ABT5UC70_9GAMM|nr:hypothetical protein [Spartinivicinus sp. A2-2]MDE1463984.1 hypothetical protein [Spartinivicinus sp. A2-2]